MISENMSELACNTLDVSEAERAALTVRESLEELVVNVDMTSLQYNHDKMMTIAGELGFEQEELEDLGIEFEESRCNMGVCNLKFNNVKGLDRMLNAQDKLRAFEDKLKCHPLMKDTVLPKVEIIWNFFPFTLICAECRLPLEFFCVICNPCFPIFCWCYYPIMIPLVSTWNLSCATLMSPIYLFCYPCWFFGWTAYYFVVPP